MVPPRDLVNVLIVVALLAPGTFARAQEDVNNSGSVLREKKVSQPPAKVEVQPSAPDEKIKERLDRILSATEWFENPQIEVRNGVVFLSGRTATDEFKQWAGELAQNTQDVAAVVNKLEVRQSSLLDITPARIELRSLWTRFVGSVPSKPVTGRGG